MKDLNLKVFQVTANNSISLAQFDYAVKFEEEYREAIASGGSVGRFKNFAIAFPAIYQNCFQDVSKYLWV